MGAFGAATGAQSDGLAVGLASFPCRSWRPLLFWVSDSSLAPSSNSLLSCSPPRGTGESGRQVDATSATGTPITAAAEPSATSRFRSRRDTFKGDFPVYVECVGLLEMPARPRPWL